MEFGAPLLIVTALVHSFLIKFSGRWYGPYYNDDLRLNMYLVVKFQIFWKKVPFKPGIWSQIPPPSPENGMKTAN